MASAMVAATVFVDGEDLTRIRASLSEDGVEVIQAAGLDEAIQTPAPVILFDADRYPGWANAVRQVVEMRPAARIVLLARNAGNRLWVEALSQGAYDLVQKPLVPLEVRSAVLGALQKEIHLTATAAAS